MEAVLRRTLLALTLALALAPAAEAAPLICLDPGHARTPNLTTEPIGPGSSIRKIKDGGGAPGEAPVVLKISRKLRHVLLDRGYRVAMTRTGPEFTLGRGGNVDRAKFCNRRRAALMLRVHADGSTDPSANGVSTLYPTWHRGWTDDVFRRSRRAARLVQRKLVARTGAADRGLVARGDLTGFNWANVPVILVETGFMTNARERRRLESRRYQWRVARGLAAGVRLFRPAR
jgi:N-acetylmuramoyl-L-alanine amidase